MSPGSSTDSYPAFARRGLRENPEKNLNQKRAKTAQLLAFTEGRAETGETKPGYDVTKRTHNTCAKMCSFFTGKYDHISGTDYTHSVLRTVNVRRLRLHTRSWFCIEDGSLITSTFPKIWKQAFVLPLPKVKVPTDPNDYRPISILPAISKALERIVHRQITNYMNEHKLFDKYQSGFRAGHNTSTALLKVTEDIREAIDSNKVTILTLLDLSKAFNSVNFDLLTHKLRNLHLSETAVSWFESYLRKDNNVLYPGIEALPGLT
ncbi:hypothetical protein ANN_10088 [Periplaneta americana]|uniref:Reverse transcriptase domain-containing protein n=1 Tax=Periplaneta americana TaxID=6978 RepID=A0ABQ8TN30_PERAM|nr:hypothetical protein ANN_10088 [Periplaneta americana]